MTSYRTETPRRTLALAAAVATIATMAFALLPAHAPEGAAVTAAAARPTEVAIIPARIDVIGVRPRDAARNDAARDNRTASDPS